MASISKPISFAKVNAALGTAHTDLAALCTANEINKWSLYKPLAFSIKTFLTYARRKLLTHGLGVPWVGDKWNVSIFYIKTGLDTNGWIYTKPSGGSNSPYRLQDFARNPNEESVGADPTPVALQGYNHSAPFPIQIQKSGAGLTRQTDFYYFNILDASSITFTLYCMGGNDINIQDFITINTYPNNCKWRMALQVFYGDMSDPTLQVLAKAGGAEITASKNGAFSVTIDFSTSTFASYVNQNRLLNVCLAIACCDSYVGQFYDPDGYSDLRHAAFLPPYTASQGTSTLDNPFYCPIKLAAYFNSDRLVFTDMQWFNTGSVRYISATKSGTNFTFTWDSDNNLWATFTIKKGAAPLHFCSINTAPASGYYGLKLKARVSIGGGSYSDFYFVPQKMSGSSYINDNAAYIPAGSTSETVTLHALVENFDIGNIPYSGSLYQRTATFYVQAYVGSATSVSEMTFYDVSQFAVIKNTQ